jgi:hypothetical protein
VGKVFSLSIMLIYIYNKKTIK